MKFIPIIPVTNIQNGNRMEFVPGTRGSEYWDKVELYKQELSYVVPQKEIVEQWRLKGKGGITINNWRCKK